MLKCNILLITMLGWSESLNRDVNFTIRVTQSVTPQTLLKCGFAHTDKIVRRDIFPSSSSTQHFFWDIFFWSTAQNHNGDSLRNELKELRKVGQNVSKISCRKPFVAPNQSERVLMRAFVGSGGLSGGGVTNRELCSQDDEQRWPVPQLSL